MICCLKGVNPQAKMHGQSGFSLLELMIAVIIFAIISMAAYAGLRQVASSADILQNKRENWQRIELAVAAWVRDVEQLSFRESRAGTGRKQASLLLKNGRMLSFTRGGQQNFLQQKISQQQRVSWYFENQSLYRMAHVYADTYVLSSENRAPVDLMSPLSAVYFEVADASMSWHSEWPVNDDIKAVAIRMTWNVEGFGVLQRIAELPVSLPRLDRSEGAE